MQNWLPALTALALWAVPGPVVASTIVWGLPTTISGDTDVSTIGTTLSAHNLAGLTVTINGVTFDATAFGIIDPHFTLTASGPLTGAPTGLGSTEAPFASLSMNYQELLDSGGFTHSPPNSPPSITLLIRNLTIGLPYQFQWWVNDSRDTGDFDRTTTATSGTSVTLEHNFANAAGGVGQFAVGAFVADATTQTIVFQGAGTGPNVGSTQINGFQLRAIPEPSSVGLVALGIALLPLAARFRKTQRAC